MMEIETVKIREDGGYLVNDKYSVPNDTGNRHFQLIQEWVASGNVPTPYTPKPEPTNAELVDMAGPVLVAFIKAYAKREGLTLVQVRDAIVGEM